MNPWDSRFSSDHFFYGTEPNIFFAEFIKTSKKPGKILLPAEGEGRNAVFAANSGWEVDAFDSSSVARRKALDFASRENVSINYNLLDINNFVPVPNKYDLIALVFVHLPEIVRIPFHQKLVTSLKTGGTLLIEAFAKEQIHNNTGGPKDIDMLFSTDILQQDFAKLTIKKLSREKVFLDEGHHYGQSEVVRMIAVRENL